MPFLTIVRAKPFTRGDQSIQILIDGKPIGMLPKEEPLIREISAGPHTVQALMNGGSGKKVAIHPGTDDQIFLRLSGTAVPGMNWWDGLIFLTACIIPAIVLPACDIWWFIGFTALLAVFEAYRYKIRSRSFLKLDITGAPAEAIPA